ncbi:GNAT family N-acetyltransferase [Dactylosporangium sp. NPDC000555]|uniref:GNAT family N-acetyltransferase n=1 Tax=Dactylosporangium sp. NPDC000555 TaxID=3154260 RepID=UPI0033202F9B
MSTGTSDPGTALIRVEGVAWDEPSAVALRDAMSAEMRLRYADRFATRVAVEAATVAYTSVAYTAEGLPVGHAALRWHGADLELKRMYVAPSHRGQGVAVALLADVERAAAALGAPRIILQTGDRQPDAVRLYEKSGYTRIPIFPPYEAMTFSNCFEKLL